MHINLSRDGDALLFPIPVWVIISMIVYTMEQEQQFIAQAPMLFGNEFMKNCYCIINHVILQDQRPINRKKTYAVEGTNNRSFSTRGDIPFGGGEVGSIHRHLEGVNKQPLGLASSQRVQDILCVFTQP